jgi:4-hydroxy-tetrahydrodipicolinate synthase
MFSGSITALITPFHNGRVDEVAFQELCAWQIEQGTSALVPCGTTGESPTLSHAEHQRVVSLCVEASDGKVPVIAGAGSNSTEEAISLAAHAKEAGAKAALVVTPYYNKPSQEGLYRHYEAIARAVDLPILIYNIPGRSVIDMSVETMARLASIPNIVGVKDATADLTRPVRVRLECGPDFCQLSGEDATAPAFMAQGGHGCISVTSNVAPRLCAGLHAAWDRGDFTEVARIRDLLMPLHHAMFVETSPAPVKYAASLLGLCTPDMRLPLVTASEPARKLIEEAMRHTRLLNS